MEKPPYRVPGMAEIAAVRGTSGLKAVSTFSGCGGSCLGFEMAGFEVRWASEFVPAAREVYELNHPGVPVDSRDVRDVEPSEILEAAGLAEGEADVMEGSPPCASFSTAGKRERKWGGVCKYSETRQRVDDLFFEFARLVRGVRPRVFVAENVSGLVKGVAKGYFKMILRELRSCGYRVEARLLDAQWLGVPQVRKRLIFVGVREDLGRDPAFPRPLPYRYSVRDALPWISRQMHGEGFGRGRMREATVPSKTIGTGPNSGNGAFPSSLVEDARVVHDTRGNFGRPRDVTDEPCPCVTVGVKGLNSEHFKVHPASLEGTAIGREAEKLLPGEQSDRYFSLVRADPDGPSPTVTQAGGCRSCASVVHPTEPRKFTIGELKRICGFPDDFRLTGTYRQQWERLGRAVPPPMMRAVAEAVRDEVLGKVAADE